MREMGLARRLATDWPIGQPVVNPSEISREQQTDSQTSKSPAIFPDQHQIHTTSSATREERGLAPYSVPVPVLPGADQRRLRVVLLGQSPFLHRLHRSLRKQGDWLSLRCLTPFFRRSFCQENCACSLCSLINNATSFA